MLVDLVDPPIGERGVETRSTRPKPSAPEWAELAGAYAPTLITDAEVYAMVDSLGDVGEALKHADTDSLERLSRELGLGLRYQPPERAVDVTRHTHACPAAGCAFAEGSAGRAPVEPQLLPARSSSMDGPDVFARLAAEREETVERIAALERQLAGLAEEQALTAHDDEHDPEGVTIASQRAQLLGLRAGARRDLAAVDRAVDRLAGGSYGCCACCGNDIGEARLEALPSAETCIACAISGRR